jgi:protein N-terminal amidase
MDLNPYRFEADWSEFEFASHVVDTEASLVILNNAWLFGADAPQRSGRALDGTGDEPDRSTVRYWLARLEPLMKRMADDQEGETVVAICNRVGTEGEAKYAGSSLVMTFNHGRIRLWGPMGSKSPGLMVADTAAPITHEILI